MLSRKFAGTGMWCGWLLAALYLALLPLEVLADPPLVESPPLKMVDGIDRFPRKMLLRNATLITPIWLDDRYVIAITPPEPERNQGPPELPPSAWVKIDTETGKFERMSWRADRDIETQLRCLAGDRIILKEHLLYGKGRGTLIWKVGKQGGPFKEYVIENALGNELPKEWTEQGLIIGACELTKWPTHLIPKGSGYLSHLMPGHGWTLLRASWDMPKTPGDTFVWIKPDGSTLQIPLTEGETNPGGGIYIAYENAYFIQPADLHYGSPQKRWTPHYARLLHLDGRIDLFPVPEPIFKMVSATQGNHALANAIYTRRGPIWYLRVRDKPDATKLNGFHIVIGDELVRIARITGDASPNGCKLLGQSERTEWEIRHPNLAKPSDYFVIDLCKDN